MTKEEQLKIFSAYLPYKLKIECYSDEEIEVGGNYITTLSGVNQDGISDNLGNDWHFGVRPIFYDLSYLTKEIEHEGRKFIPMEYFTFKSTQQAFEGLAEFNEHLVNYLKYDDVKQLLKWHFNVFGIPEDQYINKGNLKP